MTKGWWLGAWAWAILSGAAQDPSKLPLPSEADQAQALKLVRDVFKDEYARKTPADRLALARKLLDQARGAKNDPAALFILLREARELAVQGGDLQTAWKAVDELAARFAVDAASLRQSVLATAAKAAKTPEEFAALARSYARLGDDAAASDDYDSAGKAYDLASSSARKGKDVALISRIDLKAKRNAGLKDKCDRAKKAAETLLENPADPAANLTVGRFECLVRGRWKEGLVYLSKGADEALRLQAAKDLADPADPPEQLAVGDGWWDLAEKEQGVEREQLRERCYFWYQRGSRAMSGGLQKVKVEKRMAVILAERTAEGPWIVLSDPALFDAPGMPGEPIVLERKGVNLKSLPPGVFDGLSVRIVTLSSNGSPNVQHAPLKEMVCLDTDDKSIAIQHYSGTGWKVGPKAPLPAGTEYLVTLLLEDGKIMVTVNGAEVLKAKSDTDRLLPIRLAIPNGKASFSEIRIRKKE